MYGQLMQFSSATRVIECETDLVCLYPVWTPQTLHTGALLACFKFQPWRLIAASAKGVEIEWIFERLERLDKQQEGLRLRQTSKTTEGFKERDG